MQAPHDQNTIKAKMGVWCVDGVTPIAIAIDPATGEMKVDEVSTISYTPENIMPRDENHQPVWEGVSSDDDVTVLPINVNADGEVLVDVN